MNNELNLNKLIVRTSLVTLSIIVMAFFSFVGICTFFNPKLIAEISNSLNLNDATIFYYELTYKKTQDRNDLYVLLNETIKQDRPKKTSSYFEAFFENGNSEYYDFIDYINNHYMESTQNMMYKTYLVNEDARLKNRYITALLEENKTNKAFEFLINDLQNEVFLSINDYSKLNFIATSFVSYLIKQEAEVGSYEKFASFTYENEQINYLERAVNYYNSIKQIYDVSYYVRGANENSFKLYVVANNLLKTANTICYIDDRLNNSIDTGYLQNDIADYLSHLEILELELSQ